MEFGGILTGRGPRSREPEDQRPVEFPPVGSVQDHGVAAALKEAGAEFILELADLLADGAGRKMKAGGTSPRCTSTAPEEPHVS